MTRLTKERRDACRQMVAGGVRLLPSVGRDLLDEIDALTAERDEARAEAAFCRIGYDAMAAKLAKAGGKP